MLDEKRRDSRKSHRFFYSSRTLNIYRRRCTYSVDESGSRWRRIGLWGYTLPFPLGTGVVVSISPLYGLLGAEEAL